jgi:nucleoside-diphosphate-sugar epimerase
MTRKVLITGGSGFIGTNMVERLLSNGTEILSIDKKPPQNNKHYKVHKNIDIRNFEALRKIVSEFSPTQVVHLAARTDLHEKRDLDGYSSNIQGVKNLIEAISHISTIERCIFTSTRKVCQTEYIPKSDTDYCPDTLYGKSKVLGENIVRNSDKIKCVWCIVRPTSIWGPWSILPHIPYGKFFIMIARGQYFHPQNIDTPKSFGYVGNTLFQFEKLLNVSEEKIHRRVFYLSDYNVFMIRDWANLISLNLRKKKVPTIPMPLVRLLAFIGDLMKLCGIPEPPLSTFRLKNMLTKTNGVPLSTIKNITGPLPYSIEDGVKETIEWLTKYRIIA